MVVHNKKIDLMFIDNLYVTGDTYIILYGYAFGKC